MKTLHRASIGLLLAVLSALAESRVAGRVVDPQGRPVPGATIRLESAAGYQFSATANSEGCYQAGPIADGVYQLMADAPGLAGTSRKLTLTGQTVEQDITLSQFAAQRQSIVISAKAVEPEVDLRNAEVFNRTLFTRDDQVLQQLNAGINAGQHEGGGKSLEIRRFGFNLDHGGVNGGLKVLVDDVQQNQGTQGHGQGYLGALKALSPELIEDVTITNGPFSAEYGDFSGLGVVHIHQRESLPDEYTVRLQGGNFNTGRGFLAYSPDVERVDAYLAYEGSYTDGPFQNPRRYRRDNVNGNYTHSVGEDEKLGFRILFGRNNFYSSGQIPLDLVSAGLLDRFGYIDPSDGGRVKLGTVSTYLQQDARPTATRSRRMASCARSLFDLYSNFTFFLNDPVNGDAFQQHDSRLQEGLNAQYTHIHKLGPVAAVLVAGANFHDNEINVGLYPRDGRVPTGCDHSRRCPRDQWRRLCAGEPQPAARPAAAGRRHAVRRVPLRRGGPSESRGERRAGGRQVAGKGQSSRSRPARRVPLTLHLNYGRGINSIDARGVVQMPSQPRLATTDFYQAGTSSNFGRLSIATDVFLIDHSNEQVYIPDDGSFEFKGPSRAYGYEAKASVALDPPPVAERRHDQNRQCFLSGAATIACMWTALRISWLMRR